VETLAGTCVVVMLLFLFYYVIIYGVLFGLCALYLFYVLVSGGEPLWNLLLCVMANNSCWLSCLMLYLLCASFCWCVLFVTQFMCLASRL